MIRYQYDLVCPRCGNTAGVVSPRDYVSLKCNNCLMGDMEVVDMDIVHTTPITPKRLEDETQ